MPPTITVVKGSAKGKKVNLAGLDVLRVGRAPENDLVIGEPETSRFHCILRRNGDRWAVFDMGAANGTVVDGRRIKEHTLTEGDLISIGKTVLLFGAPKSARTKPTPRPAPAAEAPVEPVASSPEPEAPVAPPPAEKPPSSKSTTVAMPAAEAPETGSRELIPEDEDEARPSPSPEASVAPSAPRPAEEPASTEVMPAMPAREEGQAGALAPESEEDEEERVEAVNKESQSPGLQGEPGESDSDVVAPDEPRSSGFFRRLGGLLRRRREESQDPLVRLFMEKWRRGEFCVRCPDGRQVPFQEFVREATSPRLLEFGLSAQGDKTITLKFSSAVPSLTLTADRDGRISEKQLVPFATLKPFLPPSQASAIDPNSTYEVIEDTALEENTELLDTLSKYERFSIMVDGKEQPVKLSRKDIDKLVILPRCHRYVLKPCAKKAGGGSRPLPAGPR